MPESEFSAAEASLLERYFTNLDRPVFALRNLPEVVKGALFSRYSRTEKSLRRVLLDEFINEPDSGFERLAGSAPVDDDMVAVRRAEEFYERVLVGYGDDSVAELAGAHVAVEQTSTLAAKALEDSRIGLSPLEKSTRYVRFDRRAADGAYLFYRGPELARVIPAFVRRALDDRYGTPAAVRMAATRSAASRLAQRGDPAPTAPSVRLVEFDPDAQRKVVAAALFPHSNLPLEEQMGDVEAVLDAMLGDRSNRRQRAPRALEHATYTFEIVANFAAYRDLQRHRMLTQDRHLLGTALGYDVAPGMRELGMDGVVAKAGGE